MTSLDQLKLTFFDECEEALQQIETGLTALRDGGGAEDTLNAVFRAVHSVKGGAGIFGFAALVGFAHTLETVLDELRRGRLDPTPPVVDVLLSAGDVLSDLVQRSRAGEEIAEDCGGDCRLALEHIIAGGDAAEAGEAEAADFDDIDFVPLRADEMDDGAAPPHAIGIRPHAAVLPDGLDLLVLLDGLRALGAGDLAVATDALPTPAALDPAQCYLCWTATIPGDVAAAAIEDVVAPFRAGCAIEIAGGLVAADLAAATALPPPSAAPPPVSDKPVAAKSVAKSAATKPAATTTRIELAKIDRVVNMVGELVIAQAMLSQIVQDLPEDIGGALTQTLDAVIHHTRELKDSVMSMRAQPVGLVFERMPRLVRELSAKTGKKVRLDMTGEATEVDRSIIERLSDPLTHIIRNAVDHGIEPTAARLAAGKPEEGTIRLAAEHRGGHIVITVSDDGGGIDPDRVLEKARERGLIGPDAAPGIDEINNLIMLPGFSTAATVSDISGRGVGMDVVRSNIQDIGGRVALRSRRGRGLSVELALPLTLAVMDGMVIRAAGETYVIPLSAIVECLRPAPADFSGLPGTPGLLRLREELLPLVPLAGVLDLDPAAAAAVAAETIVIVVDGGGARFGLVVDELCGHQQVVIKSIEESYGAVPGIAAATILGNGRVAFVLDMEKLAALATAAPRQAA